MLRVQYIFPETSIVQETSNSNQTKDLEAKLEDAQAEIMRLRSLVVSGSVSAPYDGAPYAAAAAQSFLSASPPLMACAICTQHQMCRIREGGC